MGRVREKNCDRCQVIANVLYRVKVDATGQWQFVCDRCWPTVQQDNPDYTYGGTWKAHKRN